MTELNSEIINWVQFAKGDVPGHAFHGNQWGAGVGGAINEAISHHLGQATAHSIARDKADALGDTKTALLNDKAVTAHINAVKAYQDAKEAKENVEDAAGMAGATDATPEMRDMYNEANSNLQDALINASDASKTADAMSRAARG